MIDQLLCVKRLGAAHHGSGNIKGNHAHIRDQAGDADFTDDGVRHRLQQQETLPALHQLIYHITAWAGGRNPGQHGLPDTAFEGNGKDISLAHGLGHGA